MGDLVECRKEKSLLRSNSAWSVAGVPSSKELYKVSGLICATIPTGRGKWLKPVSVSVRIRGGVPLDMEGVKCMKIKNIEEVEGFLEAVNKCKGEVWLESPEGDKFNLKSKFSRYIALGALLSESGDNLELFCSLPEDECYFYEYFTSFPGVN